MIKITFEGNTKSELNEAIKDYLGATTEAVKEPKEKRASTVKFLDQVIEEEVKEEADEERPKFDNVTYSGKSTARNLWILLTDGRILKVEAGGTLPVDEEREKNLTKKEYERIAEEEPHRVVKDISEVIDEKIKEDKKPVKEDKEDETDNKAKAKQLVKEVKEIEGGEEYVKELLEDFDVKRVSKIEDASDLEDFIEDLEDFIEESED